MIAIDGLERLKREVAELQRKHDRLKGAKDQLLKRLKEFGCRGLKEAKAKLKVDEEMERRIAVKYATMLKAFEEEFKGQLSELGEKGHDRQGRNRTGNPTLEELETEED